MFKDYLRNIKIFLYECFEYFPKMLRIRIEVEKVG